MNPFEWNGPAFLQFYAVLIVIASIGVWLVRRSVRGGCARLLGTSRRKPTLDAYETAYLAGGDQRTTLLAVATLLDRGALTMQSTRQQMLVALPAGASRATHPIERTLVTVASKPISPTAVRHILRPGMETIKASLQQHGLLLNDGTRSLGRLLTFLLVGSVLAIGITKIVIGIQRDRPVEFLVAMSFVYLVGNAVALGSRPLWRTNAGDALLKELRTTQPRPIRQPAGIEYGTAVPTLVALWGIDALVGHPYREELREAYVSGGSSGGGDSSTSSDSDGGGGDGGGGGGCGGCGGGGGGD